MDIQKLRKSVKHFERFSRPTNADPKALCTVGDLNNAVELAAKAMNAIIDELEEIE